MPSYDDGGDDDDDDDDGAGSLGASRDASQQADTARGGAARDVCAVDQLIAGRRRQRRRLQ